jgi:cytochrome c oxidase assembly protein subunit 15
MAQASSHRKLIVVLRTLLVMILGLMALGAGVRTMNAGLSCPDWPLCFGKVIPDFHPGVWFEFVHRAYAGLVAIVFAGSCAVVLFSRDIPLAAKRASVFGIFFLFMQIAAGALTVLWKVKAVAVTSHLMLATMFFCSVLWMLLSIDPRVKPSAVAMPSWLKYVAGFFAFGVLMQILMGGIVASTYAGSVCVDWPLCDGQWVPTWSGAIGHQIIHRFIAYTLAISTVIFAVAIQRARAEPWVTRQFLALSRMAVAVVCLQVCIGIANLVLFIPPWVTVLHQSVAIVLLATFIRIFQVARALGRVAARERTSAFDALAPHAGGASG